MEDEEMSRVSKKAIMKSYSTAVIQYEETDPGRERDRQQNRVTGQ